MNNSTYLLIAGAVVVFLVVGGAFWLQQQEATPAQTTPPPPPASGVTPPPQGGSPQQEQGEEHEILFTDSGYSPDTIKVAPGDTVTFKNRGSRFMWPATDLHPTHTIYPGSDITKCNSEEAVGMFDSCSPLEVGQEWGFTFEEQGNWTYHDHLRPGHKGTIIVE